MKPAARRKARRLAIQAVYSWQINDGSITDTEAHFLTDANAEKVDLAYFQDLLRGVAQQTSVLDNALSPHTARPFAELDQIERAILRVAAYELKARPDVPYKVIMNEAIELAKAFGADDSHRFVNGVLDKAVDGLRDTRL